MKKSLLITLFTLAFLSAFATIWHVNNNAGIVADFSDLAAAFNSALVVDGDTLYIYGSGVSYGEPGPLTKRLSLIGPGYFLNQNAGLQYNQLSANINYLLFQAGSEGSLVSGMVISRMEVQAANVVVQRNNIQTLYIQATNCMVLQNMIYSAPSGYYPLLVTTPNSIVVANNYIQYGLSNWAFYMEDGCSGTFYNNVAWGGCRFVNTEVYNCILGWSGGWWELPFAVVGSSSIHHSVLEYTQDWNWYAFTNDPTNVYNVSSQIFVSGSSYDGNFHLVDGSAAIGAGVGGTDCGIFGGNTPYKLSGIPAIPTIYNFVAPATGFTIPIQLGARSNN